MVKGHEQNILVSFILFYQYDIQNILSDLLCNFEYANNKTEQCFEQVLIQKEKYLLIDKMEWSSLLKSQKISTINGKNRFLPPTKAKSKS